MGAHAAERPGLVRQGHLRRRTTCPATADDWLKARRTRFPALLKKGEELGFNFVSGQRPQPNKQGRIATTLEWAKKLTADDIKVLQGKAAYSEKVPDPDEGFTQADLKDPKKAEAVYKVIQERLDKYRKERPGGYLVREAPAEDVKQLKILVGHLKEGQFITKIRKTFTKGEMDDDLLIVPAKLGQAEEAIRVRGGAADLAAVIAACGVARLLRRKRHSHNPSS